MKKWIVTLIVMIGMISMIGCSSVYLEWYYTDGRAE